MRKLLCLSLLTLMASACGTTVKDATMCAVAGKLQAGGICSHLLTSETSDLNFDQFLDFLEATPAHGAAICMSAVDWGQMKLELEQACRELGSHCSVKTKQMIKQMSILIDRKAAQ